MHALSILNKQFVERGWNRKPTGRILFELGLNLMLSLGGISIILVSENLLVEALGMLISTAGSLGVATNTHTSSHYATCDKRWKNRALTFFGYTFYFGASTTWWWNKHVAVHHPTPNVIGFDDDADLLPAFAINARDRAAAQGIQRWWFRYQWLFIVWAISLNCFNVQFTSWRYLARNLADPASRTRSHWLDLGVLVLHLGAWLVAPALLFGWVPALTFYVLRIALMGYALFIAFAPAHFPEEAVFLAKEIESKPEYFRKADFILLQTATSVNFRTGPLGRLLCAGVEYQIEHHLFPGISHVYYPEMSAIVRKFCEENGYPYRTLGWWESIVKSLAIFRTPKPIEPRLELLRQPAKKASAAQEAPGQEGLAQEEEGAVSLPATHLVA